MPSGNKIYTDSLPPYKVYGRYVVDCWKLTEAHLFDNEREARKFASSWGRDCSIGWLPPVYDRATGRNRKAHAHEASFYIAKTVTVFDHRRQPVEPACQLN